MKQNLLLIDNLTLLYIRENNYYISILNILIKDIIKSNGSCSLKLLIKKVHMVSEELEQFCKKNENKFKISSIKDKGIIGKVVEFYLFGNLPNNESLPDLKYGDIKTTHFKNIGKNINNTFNAKERLTLTNFGDPSKEKNIDTINNKKSLQETKYYNKIKCGIIFIFHEEIYKSQEKKTFEYFYNKKIIGVIHYNLDTLFITYPEIAKIFHSDFIKIQSCIIQQNVSQCGQEYLHIHKHGCKESLTRAFGFTTHFLTKLVSIYLNVLLISKGRSKYIKFI